MAAAAASCLDIIKLKRWIYIIGEVFVAGVVEAIVVVAAATAAAAFAAGGQVERKHCVRICACSVGRSREKKKISR